MDAADAAAAVSGYAGGRCDHRRSPTTASRPTRSAASSPISTGRSAAGSSGPMAGPGCSTCTSKRRGTTQRWARRARTAGARLRRAASAIISPILTYPIRVGTHFNTAFALILSLEWAEQFDPALADADPRARAALVRRRPRLPGVGAGRRRIPLAGADRGAVHGARSSRDDFAAWFAHFLPRIDAAPAGDPVHAGDRQRPQRRQDRPSRRAEPQPRLVLAEHRAVAAGRRARDR